MLEKEEQLMTWALPHPPTFGKQVLALPLQAHRLEYLDYEGPLTENRGVVTRHDWGVYREISDDLQERVIELQGQQLCGRATIEKKTSDDEHVLFRFDPHVVDSEVRIDR